MNCAKRDVAKRRYATRLFASLRMSEKRIVNQPLVLDSIPLGGVWCTVIPNVHKHISRGIANQMHTIYYTICPVGTAGIMLH